MKFEKFEKYGLFIRLVEESDCNLILKLRTDKELSKHIHSTKYDLELQIKYIQDYKKRENQREEFYFAFSLDVNDNPIGFYRIYSIDYNLKSFTIGSWIFEKECDEKYPVLADIIAKEFGFTELNLDLCYFDVRRNNKKVLKYHSLFSPQFLYEDNEHNNFYSLTKYNFEFQKNILLDILL